ncbi:hypothetical protein OG921_19995 [Aldersonia sp. NBC_00410]|uniref:hypothetical protein n=1 Tax=Aldersonia sp. NBC_00410 TaxID=2975954 RepID=UPI002252C476|nr:hypothetical protein [Aldersonia sp. NBC_00410]MCX5045455.1 hypothetical protein [Aldersonia sp. NBC_00410]
MESADAGADVPAGPDRQERLEQLRRRIAAVPGRGEASTGRLPLAADEREVLAVPDGIARLLPKGGLVRGSVASYSGPNSLLAGLLAAATKAGAHAVLIGMPRFGLLAAVEMGARLDRIAVVPDPGPDPVEVAAVLLDGMDLVVLGLGGAAVAPTRSRALVARARSKGAALVVTDGHWTGVELSLAARVVGYEGLGRGCGRVRAVQLDVSATRRGAPSRTVRVDVRPVARGGVEWVPENLAFTRLPEAVSR